MVKMMQELGNKLEAIYDDESLEVYRQPDSNPEILREGMAHPISLDECKMCEYF